MFPLTIASLVVGLGGGVYLAAAFLPPLARTREGAIATWIVRVLFGCAVAWTCFEIYSTVHAYVNLGHTESIRSLGERRSEILTGMVQSVLLLGSLLVGSASIVYLLAPTDTSENSPEL
jgi:hypothetical protein